MKGVCSLLLLLAVFANGQQMITYIECPISGNPTTPPKQTDCDLYTACEYTDGVCHMKKNNESGYFVSSTPVNTGRGFKVTLDKFDPTNTLFNADIQQLTCEIIYHEEYHVQVKIYDANNARYEVPYPINIPGSQSSSVLYDVSTGDLGEPFVLKVTRESTGTNLLKSAGPLTFEDQFLQFTTTLPSSYLYGIGEHPHTKLRHSFENRTTWPIFARDQPVTPEVINQYGSHPYYVNMEDTDGNTHGVLFYSSNALEYSTFSLGEDKPGLTIRSIGGIMDFHVFLGPTPEDVNIQYATAVGIPHFPPYWLFGFQLSRWGYGSSDNYRVVRDRMKAAGIPMDGQTFDIDYMDGMMDFTYDQVNWPDLPYLIQELHDDDVKVVLMFDPAIVADFTSNYQPALDGKNLDVYIKWTNSEDVPSDQPAGDGQYVVGYVWPGNKTVFPDFFKPQTLQWWTDEITAFHNITNFDGIWIDMNEPSNFGTNLDHPWNWPEGQPDWSLKCPTSSLDDPPYPTLAATSHLSDSHRISDKTICMATSQTDGNQTFDHYDVHNLYGLSETMATFEVMEAIYPGNRQVVLSRSTFPGSGRLAIHWLGDNTANWQQLQMSLVGLVEFNMFAIPFVGADVCGFFDEPSEELCVRWMQAAAFYPFDRNHNTNGTADQDPANPDWSSSTSIFRDTVLLRYKYIPYFYARFHRAHMNAHSVIRPLFNVFPTDMTARDVYDEFMWSTDLLVAPAVTESAVSRDVYFPDSLWYDLVTGELAATGPLTATVDAPIEKIPVYVRGGSIIPWQEPATTTTESRTNPFGLTVALDSAQTASGEIYWDTGDIEHQMSESFIGALEFESNELTLRGQFDIEMVAGLTIETIQIYGLTLTPAAVIINGIVQDDSSWTFDSSLNVIVMTTSLPLGSNFDLFVN